MLRKLKTRDRVEGKMVGRWINNLHAIEEFPFFTYIRLFRATSVWIREFGIEQFVFMDRKVLRIGSAQTCLDYKISLTCLIYMLKMLRILSSSSSSSVCFSSERNIMNNLFSNKRLWNRYFFFSFPFLHIWAGKSHEEMRWRSKKSKKAFENRK